MLLLCSQEYKTATAYLSVKSAEMCLNIPREGVGNPGPTQASGKTPSDFSGVRISSREQTHGVRRCHFYSCWSAQSCTLKLEPQRLWPSVALHHSLRRVEGSKPMEKTHKGKRQLPSPGCLSLTYLPGGGEVCLTFEKCFGIIK